MKHKTKPDSARKDDRKVFGGDASVSHAPHTISLGLSMCVRLPRALTCLARGTPTRGPSPALPEPQQRWVSSPRLAETLGHIIDYYVIDSSDPIRVAPPRHALFSLSFVSPGPSSMPSSSRPLKSICRIIVELIHFFFIYKSQSSKVINVRLNLANKRTLESLTKSSVGFIVAVWWCLGGNTAIS